MDEQNISVNLQELLRLHGDLSLSDLARETKIPQPTLHHIIEGKTKKPRRQALEALANYFSVSIPQLTGSIPLSPTIPDAIKKSLKISTVPIIGWEDAKTWDRDKHDVTKYDEIVLNRPVDRNAFALRLQNSSLEPMFQENSILVFDPSKKPAERDFVLVWLAKSNAVTLNRLFIDDKCFYIKKDKSNGDAELIKLDMSNDKVIAVLIESRLHFN